MSVYRLPFYVCKYSAILCWYVIVEVSTQWTGKYSYSTIVMLHNTCTCSDIMIYYQAYGIATTAHIMANGKGMYMYEGGVGGTTTRSHM